MMMIMHQLYTHKIKQAQIPILTAMQTYLIQMQVQAPIHHQTQLIQQQ